MTNRTWIGDHDGNDAGSAANWSPAGAPQRGDNLNVVTGTLEVSRGDLAGNVLHLNDPLVSGGDPAGNGAPVVLDLNGHAKVSIDGSLNFGDPLTINAIGRDYLDAKGEFNSITGSINLADHAHLFVTGGQMQFFYAGSITGGVGSKLTNNGRIEMTNGNVSVPVNGGGTLAFKGYHNAFGHSVISAPIASAQTVALDPGYDGMTLELTDPSDFHALISAPPVAGRGDVSVALDGVTADSFSIHGDRVLLTDGGRPVELLRVANAGAVPITASYGPTATTLTFHINTLEAGFLKPIS